MRIDDASEMRARVSQDVDRGTSHADGVPTPADFLPWTSADPVQVIQPNKHVPRLRRIRRSQHAGRLQLMDDARRPPVADLEPPLEQRRRSMLRRDEALGRLAEQLVAIAGALAFPVAIHGTRLDRLALTNRLE